MSSRFLVAVERQIYARWLVLASKRHLSLRWQMPFPKVRMSQKHPLAYGVLLVMSTVTIVEAKRDKQMKACALSELP